MQPRAILLTLLAGVLMTALTLVGYGADLWVPGDYPTIQQAVAAARPGDAIRVAPGEYFESLTITQSGIRLIGAGDELTTVDGLGAREVVQITEAEEVRIEGFTFRNGDVLVYGYRSAGLVLAGNTFAGARFYGVWLEQSRRGATQRVETNRFRDNAWGFYSLADGPSADVYYQITGNTFLGNRHGVWLDATARFLVEGNVIGSSAGMGILVNWNNLGSRIQRNVIVDCDDGLYIVEQDDEFPGTDGRRPRTGKEGVRVYHNTLDGNGRGLSLRLVEGFPYDIANNIIHGSRQAGVSGQGPLARLQFRHNDVFSPDGQANYAGDIGDRTGREGNLSLDPQFVGADLGDYRLQETSPCIGAGVDVGLPFYGEAPDLGAFEWGWDGQPPTPHILAHPE